MIDYLYKGYFSKTHMEERGEVDDCGHSEDVEHSCQDLKCYLWRFGFAIGLHTLGDKYDIPGLRKHVCNYLKDAYDWDYAEETEHDLLVYEFAYVNSRKTDELRQWLIKVVIDAFLVAGMLKTKPDECYKFLEKCPDLAIEVLKASNASGKKASR